MEAFSQPPISFRASHIAHSSRSVPEHLTSVQHSTAGKARSCAICLPYELGARRNRKADVSYLVRRTTCHNSPCSSGMLSFAYEVLWPKTRHSSRLCCITSTTLTFKTSMLSWRRRHRCRMLRETVRLTCSDLHVRHIPRLFPSRLFFDQLIQHHSSMGIASSSLAVPRLRFYGPHCPFSSNLRDQMNKRDETGTIVPWHDWLLSYHH
jgi:hypothetical protein